MLHRIEDRLMPIPPYSISADTAIMRSTFAPDPTVMSLIRRKIEAENVK
jgi:hypothetical protein